jgi:hypothetical protein
VVGVGVGISVTVGVCVAVGTGSGAGAGAGSLVGSGVETGVEATDTAPIVEGFVLAKPRWSSVIVEFRSAAPITGLPAPGNLVNVVPPLLANAPRLSGATPAVVAKINPVPVLLTNALELLKNEKVAVLPLPMVVSASPVSLKIEFDTVYAPADAIIVGLEVGSPEVMLPEKVVKFAVKLPSETAPAQA